MLIGVAPDEKEDLSQEICEELIAMIAKIFQAPGVLIFHEEDAYKKAEGRVGV